MTFSGPKSGDDAPATPVLTPAGGHINKLHEAIKNKKSLRTLSDDTQSKRLVFMSEVWQLSGKCTKLCIL